MVHDVACDPATSAASVKTGDAPGPLRCDGIPSWPWSFEPQHQSEPSVRIAHVLRYPALTFDQVDAEPTCVGVATPSMVSTPVL